MRHHIVSFEPPGKPWSTNKDRTFNRYERYELILAWHTAASLAWTSYCNRKKIGRGLESSLIRIEIPFNVKRRRDPHNYCGTVVKAIIDGFVRAGAWEDDTPEYVEHLPPLLHQGKLVTVRIYGARKVLIPCEHGIKECNFDDCQGTVELTL